MKIERPKINLKITYPSGNGCRCKGPEIKVDFDGYYCGICGEEIICDK